MFSNPYTYLLLLFFTSCSTDQSHGKKKPDKAPQKSNNSHEETFTEKIFKVTAETTYRVYKEKGSLILEIDPFEEVSKIGIFRDVDIYCTAATDIEGEPELFEVRDNYQTIHEKPQDGVAMNLTFSKQVEFYPSSVAGYWVTNYKYVAPYKEGLIAEVDFSMSLTQEGIAYLQTTCTYTIE